MERLGLEYLLDQDQENNHDSITSMAGENTMASTNPNVTMEKAMPAMDAQWIVRRVNRS